MEKTKIFKSFSESTKAVTLTICFVLLFAVTATPLSAQLTPARDLTGTWQSSVSGIYYSMDPSDSSTKMNDITATFKMEITQQGKPNRHHFEFKHYKLPYRQRLL